MSSLICRETVDCAMGNCATKSPHLHPHRQCRPSHPHPHEQGSHPRGHRLFSRRSRTMVTRAGWLSAFANAATRRSSSVDCPDFISVLFISALFIHRKYTIKYFYRKNSIKKGLTEKYRSSPYVRKGRSPAYLERFTARPVRFPAEVPGDRPDRRKDPDRRRGCRPAVRPGHRPGPGTSSRTPC